MPIAEATAILYLAPVVVVLLASPVLGERIGVTGWVAVLLGFTGVLLIVRPGSGLDPLGVFLALVNVAFTATYSLFSRHLAQTESTMAMLFNSALLGAICLGTAMPWFWFRVPPNPVEIGLIGGLAVTAALGHYCFTSANRFAPASLLAPVTYMHLLWAAVLGWLVFGQFPPAIGLAGMGVVLAAGVLAAMRSRFAHNR
jgi:drug/metabolite transporter (DMT)-like permease